jgi:hypothetical protein
VTNNNSSSSSSKKAADAADKAAAVAALNAALNKPTAAGSGSSSSDEKVDMTDVLAQLRRAMEADVARDVLKMKESTAGSSSCGEASPAAPAAAAEVTAGSLSPTEPQQEVPAPAPVAEDPAPEPVAAADAVATNAADSTSTAAATDGAGDSSSSTVTTAIMLSSSAVGEAGTYSRMLPKGWGPRLGVGFSTYPRSRNNIVSSASLTALKPGTAGDALSGSAAGETA